MMAGLPTELKKIISAVFDCREDEVTDISVLKKGMTNRSFLFTVHKDKYIIRIPGEGTEKLIDRSREAAVYDTISGLGLCDDPVYINPKTGYKVTRYIENVRVCDPRNVYDLECCMKKLRDFHGMNLKVDHCFDLFAQTDFYESLWEGEPSIFEDYSLTKQKVFSLRTYIEGMKSDSCLAHIDAVADNFLFYPALDKRGEDLQLTDWEYAGMQDPHVDVAMFCIYSLYDKKDCDRLMDIYFEGNCTRELRTKIYCYISICGLLWSNWCEYKRKFGVEFGEYSLRQYRYAKDYFEYAVEMLV